VKRRRAAITKMCKDVGRHLEEVDVAPFT